MRFRVVFVGPYALCSLTASHMLLITVAYANNPIYKKKLAMVMEA